jgi:hypothetical protein
MDERPGIGHDDHQSPSWGAAGRGLGRESIFQNRPAILPELTHYEIGNDESCQPSPILSCSSRVNRAAWFEGYRARSSFASKSKMPSPAFKYGTTSVATWRS